MKVRFYNFAKRTKETLQPTSASYTEKDLILKEGCNVVEPIFLTQTFIVGAYNYAYVLDWNRYYFISDSKFIEGMFEVSLTEDYLASFKTEIGSTSCMILYASGSTKNIVDPRIPVIADVVLGHEQSAISGATINTSGMGAVIVGITGNGSFGAYLLKYSGDIKELLDGCDNYWNGLSITDTTDALKQMWYGGSAAECLKSAISIPLVLAGSDVSGGSAEDLYLGGYPCKNSNNSSIQGYHINKPVVTYTTTISIPWQSSDWKKVSQYTDITLFIPMVGFMSVPATEAQKDTSLDVRLCINVTSGDISCAVVGTQSGRSFGLASGNCAMNTAYGSTGIDTNKMMSGTITGVGATIAAGVGLLNGGLSTAATLAIGGSFFASAKMSIDAMGGTGSGSAGLGGGASHCIDSVIHIWVTQKQLSESQTNVDPIMGKPYMGVSTPSAFSGYVQTDGFQLASIRVYSSERDKINQMLDQGIYYT